MTLSIRFSNRKLSSTASSTNRRSFNLGCRARGNSSSCTNPFCAPPLRPFAVIVKPRAGVDVSFTAVKYGSEIKTTTESSVEDEEEDSDWEVTPSAIHLVEIEAEEVSEDEEEDLDAPFSFEKFVARDEVFASDDDTESSYLSEPSCTRRNRCEECF